MKTGTYVKSTILVLILLMSATFFVMASNTAAAAQDGDYIYSTSGSPLVATIIGYTGTGGAIAIPSTLGGYVVVSIGDPEGANMPFYHSTSMTSITIPNSVTSIGYGAFAFCNSLTSVTMGNNVKTIGFGAFQSCTSLPSITIPNSVTIIGDHAFRNCTSLISATLGNGVTSIGYAAFAECANLTSITIPNSVTTIGDYAISYCVKMTSVTIGTSVASIGAAAFYQCTSLTSVTIGSGVTSIGASAFYNCASLTSMTFSGLVAPTTVGFGWLSGTDTNLRGHAYAASSFPAPGLAWHGLVMGTVIPFLVPDAPTGLSAIPGNTQVALNWTAPTNGGSAVDYYVVYQDGVAFAAHPAGLSTIITGLTNGQAYSFTVVAHNLAGLGTQSGAASATPYTVPNAPTALTATPSNAQMVLSWTAPVFNGGNAIDYYVIYQDGVALAVNPTIASATITGLTNGQSYSFAVAAHNQADIGAQSGAASSIPFTVPNAPTGLTATPSNAQVILSWTAPVFNGGRGLTGYKVYRSTTETGIYTLIAIASPSATTYTDTGRSNGQTYWYNVSAVNAAGEGAKTALVSSTPFTVPNAPTGLTAAPGNEQIALNWTAPASDGGSLITGYRVYRSTTESGTYTLIVSLSGTTYTDTGLTDGQAYWYKVSAVNAKGEGDRCYATSATSTVSSMTWLLALAVGIVIAIVLVVLIMRSSKKKGNFPGQKPPSYQYPPTSYPNRQMPPSPAQVQPIVYCNNCGAPLAGGAFCQKCGRQVK